MLIFFSRLTTISKSEYNAEFNRFYKQLFEGDKPLADAGVLDYIDIKSWLEEKINR